MKILKPLKTLPKLFENFFFLANFKENFKLKSNLNGQKLLLACKATLKWMRIAINKSRIVYWKLCGKKIIKKNIAILD